MRVYELMSKLGEYLANTEILYTEEADGNFGDVFDVREKDGKPVFICINKKVSE